LKSEGNQTRQGMQDLPAILALGPQLVFKLPQEWNFKLGWFYALASDGRAFWFPGSVYEARLDRQWQKDLSHWRDHTKSISKFTVSFKMASKDFNALYYSVPEQDVRTDRVSYEARGGNMGLEYSFFQMLQTGLAGFYAGMSYSDYSISSNRSSPLYKTEWSLTGFFGLNYILGESQRASVPLKETQGLINQMRQRRTDPF
jgi:hypothetical protein